MARPQGWCAQAPARSREWVTFRADHIDFGIALLHVHRAGDDELLYRKLIERRLAVDLVLEDVRGHAAQQNLNDRELIRDPPGRARIACVSIGQGP